MTRRIRGLLTLAVAASALTAVYASPLSRIRVVGGLLWFLCAPPVFTATFALQWIQPLYRVSPALYSAALAHLHIIRPCLFWLVAFLWIGFIFAPVFFGLHLFSLSPRSTQFVVLLCAVAVTAVCFYILVASFPYPD